MKLGFVGVGKIATSVIEGIFKAKINVKEMILSPRNKKNSKSLKNKFKLSAQTLGEVVRTWL